MQILDRPSKPAQCSVKPLSTVLVVVVHASVASSKPKADIVYSYDPKDRHRRAKAVNAAEGYQDPQSGQKFILVFNQAICIDGLHNHLLCPMQF